MPARPEIHKITRAGTPETEPSSRLLFTSVKPLSYSTVAGLRHLIALQ